MSKARDIKQAQATLFSPQKVMKKKLNPNAAVFTPTLEIKIEQPENPKAYSPFKLMKRSDHDYKACNPAARALRGQQLIDVGRFTHALCILENIQDVGLDTNNKFRYYYNLALCYMDQLKRPNARKIDNDYDKFKNAYSAMCALKKDKNLTLHRSIVENSVEKIKCALELFINERQQVTATKTRP